MADGRRRMVRGTLVAFDDSGWLATVRLDGSAPQVIEGIAVNRGLVVAALVAGRRCLIEPGGLDEPEEMILVAVY